MAEEEEEDRGGAPPQSLADKMEIPLLTLRECFCYRIPPLHSASGHRADSWGLDKPLFTGEMKLVQRGEACCVRLFSPPPATAADTPNGALSGPLTLFAEATIRLDSGRSLNHYVEGVMDSSRYFVLRCEDEKTKRHAYVGIGFRERSSAFDMKAVLDDFVRSVHRQHKAEQLVAQHEESGTEGEGDVKPLKDLSIGKGKKIHLSVCKGGREVRRPSKGGGGLSPPPPPGQTFKAFEPPPQETGKTEEDEDWGDFASA